MKSMEILKSIRGSKLKTQEQIACIVGISRQTYNDYENNPMNCSISSIFKILNALDVDIKDANKFFNAIKEDYLSKKGE